MSLKSLCKLGLLAGLLGVAPSWAQNTISLSCPSGTVAPGAALTCAVNLSLGNGVTVDTLDVGLSFTANGGAPAPTTKLKFLDTTACAVQGGSPCDSLNGTTATQIAPIWTGLSPVLSGASKLGDFTLTVPATAVGAQTYAAAIAGISASLGNTVVNVSIVNGTQTITVPSVLSFTTPAAGALPPATKGGAFSQTFTATGGTAPYTWKVNAGSLPAGLGISTNVSGQGVISGTPTASGQFNNIIVTVTDSAGAPASVSNTYTLLVNPAITAVAPANLPSGTVGAAYASGNITVTGGTPPYKFTTTANLANIGLALAPVSPATANVATISGTPTSGVTNLSIPLSVTDANGATGGGTVTLTITGIAITAPAGGALANGTVNLIYHGPNGVSVTSAGGTGNITWSVSVGALPTGLTLGTTGANNATATITGTPTATTTVPGPNFTLKATDANSISATQQYSITVYSAPSLTAPASLAIATVGSAYSTNPFTLTGGAPPVVWSATGLPNGLTMNANTGAITGTPAVGTNTPVGTPDNVQVTVTDANGATSQKTSTLTVDAALSITTASPLPAATLNGPYSPTPPVTITGTGGSGTGYTWSATNLPAGLSIAAGTGVISGTPTGGSANNVSITLTDSTNSSISKTFSITVNAALAVTTAALPQATLNAGYTLAATSSGGTAPLAWSATGLPTGLSIAANGTISGTPTTNASSPYTVVLTVKDTNGAQASSGNLNLVVNNALTVGGPASLPTADAGAAYTTVSGGSNVITQAGGTAPIAFSISGLPANFGLSISNTGVITGTPATNAGQPFTVKVTATDANQATAFQNFTLNVNPAMTLSFTPLGANANSLAVAVPGAAYKETFTAGGGSGAGYTFAASGLNNTGLSITGAGVLSGTPAAAATGNKSVTVTVTDSLGYSTNFNYTLTIAPPLSITTTATPPAGTVNVLYAGFTIAATGGSTPYTWSATNLPPGLKIGSANGSITGTPTAIAGSPYSVAVTVTDANGTTATSNFSITVGALPLTIITGLLPTGVINAPYPFTSIIAKGGVGTYSWTVTGLPSGLTADGNGNISGTPTTTTGSPFSVTATVTDATKTAVSRTYSLAVSAVLTVVLPTTLPAAVLNAAYTPVTVTAGGGLPPYTWTATGLPAGMNINVASGVISGTPTTATGSPFSVTVTVTDGSGKTATMNYSLAVSSQLTITGPATLPAATLGAAYTPTTITAGGGSTPYTWSASGLPTGLSIAAATGIISGTPGGAQGNVNVTVTVTDSTSATATMNYTLVVNQAPGSPTISSVSASTEGQAFISPNTWVSIYGNNFAAAGFTDNWTNAIKNSPTGALPTVLDNISVSIGGKAAYIYYISATQINVLAGDIGFGPLAVTVTNSTGTSSAVMVTSQATIPGFFEWPNSAGQTPGDTSQQPVATRADYSDVAANGTFTTTTTPAKPGETISLWGSGFGTTSPANPFGVAVPTTGGPFMSTGTVTVSINNGPATVANSNAVLSAGLAGVFQVEVTVPSTLPDGTYPINVTIGGVTSPTLSLAVHK